MSSIDKFLIDSNLVDVSGMSGSRSFLTPVSGQSLDNRTGTGNRKQRRKAATLTKHKPVCPPPPAGPTFEDREQLVALYKLGRYKEAEDIGRNITMRYPAHGFGWKALGTVFQMQGHADKALEYLHKAATIFPGDPEIHYNLGGCLKDLGRLPQAENCFRRAVEIKPDYAEAQSNLGMTLQEMGRLGEAESCCRLALHIKPSLAEAHNNLGNILKDMERLDEAVTCYRQALEVKPDYAEAYNNLGNILTRMGRLEEAYDCLMRAITLNPRSAESHNNLGNTFRNLGRHEEAMACYRHALEITPDSTEVHSNLILAMNYSTGHEPSQHLAEALKYGQKVSLRVGSMGYTTWQCDQRPERLRVGLVSGDLKNHPVGYFLENLLARLDTTKVELVAFPTQIGMDNLSRRIRSFVGAWKPLYGLSDDSAARRIHDERIHILIDISGHTAHNRLPVFAWRPAPVQISWLGYVGTTGLEQMDYLLADAVRVPETDRHYFTEKIWYLPDTRLCFTPPDINLPIHELPALKRGYITFACFQNFAKLSDAAFMAWGRIMTALPTARLRLQCKQLADESLRQMTFSRMNRCGLDPARVTLFGPASRHSYLAAYADVDIVLDTFPFSGTTTTCEALWMGVPTVTIAGNWMAARNGASVLTAAGLAGWVAKDEADYVAKALAASHDVPKLAELRCSLREQALASPLFDSPRFARQFETALWGMWHQHTQLAAVEVPA